MKIRKRVLLLEDDPGTQLLLKKMLQKIDEEMVIVTAHSAESAYMLLNEAQWDGLAFDTVVADVNLPGSTGLLLWEVVMNRFPVEFLFISGMTPEMWKKCTSKLALPPPYLQKPVLEGELKRFWRSPGIPVIK